MTHITLSTFSDRDYTQL